MLPDFLVIGAFKAGTTSLHHYLDKHPRIFMTRLKEPNFFAHTKSDPNHDNRNMPIILAGGGFKHGQHLAFNQDRNYPLPNLFVSMLQRMGLEVDTFGTSTGTMAGLEMA